MRTLIVATLHRPGHQVDIAENGRVAAEKLEKNPAAFDLIVTDTHMPELGGLELIKKARATGYKGRFIVFAAAITAEDRDRYRALNVDHVIEKPGHKGELADAVAQVAAGD